MRYSLRTGICFGLTSAIITTLGLMVGLYSGTSSEAVVIGGLIIIAIADALSDSLGIHISEESKNNNSKELWEATFSTFASKFITSLTFLPALFLLPLEIAVLVNILWGLLVLATLSYLIAKDRKESVWKVVGEHLLIAIVVILITHWLGTFIARLF